MYAIRSYYGLVGEDNDRDEERHITVYLDMVQCPRCSRCMSNYYEGTLQVRAMNRFLNDKERIELDDFVRDEAEKRLNKDRMAFISKYIPQKEGFVITSYSIHYTKLYDVRKSDFKTGNSGIW